MCNTLEAIYCKQEESVASQAIAQATSKNDNLRGTSDKTAGPEYGGMASVIFRNALYLHFTVGTNKEGSIHAIKNKWELTKYAHLPYIIILFLCCVCDFVTFHRLHQKSVLGDMC